MKKNDFNDFHRPLVAENIIFLDEVGSTNDYAKDLGRNGALAGTVIIANAQTAGRGRLGRIWDSGDAEGIYMSVLLKPRKNPAHLTLMAGVCVANVLSRILGDTKALIKWPNDVIVGGKKICGILTEGGTFGAVLGIGINVGREKFPLELADKATSLRILTGLCYDRAEIIKMLLTELSVRYERFDIGGIRTFIVEYKDLCVNIGNDVMVHGNDGTYKAVAIDIDNDGRLLVKLEDGERCVLNSGEVSVRGVYGYL